MFNSSVPSLVLIKTRLRLKRRCEVLFKIKICITIKLKTKIRETQMKRKYKKKSVGPDNINSLVLLLRAAVQLSVDKYYRYSYD